MRILLAIVPLTIIAAILYVAANLLTTVSAALA
jgi:hypothetical protein